ncbi:DUF309 domain-containing protein [Peredibacter sp. HCB2-198]|uniref:DUF309 domain-containing protein n=1 Tax=Peredibacter sp. HCB2-198 TaxID=3383025 RepID=UPI0038B65D4D
MKRLIPDWPFPHYIFVPGENPHPKKSGGHMEGQGDPIAKPLDLHHPEQSEFLRYSLDLFNAEYYWESHVYLEALWNAHGRVGNVADFLKGLIKLGAAGVKVKINQKVSATDHFLRAKELFFHVMQAEGKNYLGFDLEKLNQDIDLAMSSENMKLTIYPSWA